MGLISNQGAGSKSIDERGPRIGGAHRARIGPRIGGLFWVLKGGRRKEEGGAGSANIAQSHRIYSAHRVAHRVWLVEGGGRREEGGGRRERGGAGSANIAVSRSIGAYFGWRMEGFAQALRRPSPQGPQAPRPPSVCA